MPSSDGRQLYPLSSIQREVWLHQLLHPDNPIYNIGGYARIDGPLDTETFRKSLGCLVREQDALRTVLRDHAPLPLQEFLPEATAPDFQYIDFSSFDQPDEEALRWMREKIGRPFELFDALLSRFALIRSADDRHYFVGLHHHIATDGYSHLLILPRVAKIYNQILAGTYIPETYSYRNFIEEDREYEASARFKEDEAYWLNKLQAPPPTLIPLKYADRFPTNRIPSRVSTLGLSSELWERLSHLGRRYESTPWHVIMGALYLYFLRINNLDECVIGVPRANRYRPNFKKTMGMFTVVSPVRLSFGTQLSFVHLLKSIREESRRSIRYQRFHTGKISKQAGLHRVGRTQFYDVSLSFLPFPVDASFGESSTDWHEISNGWNPIPLLVAIKAVYAEKDVTIDFSYSRAAFTDPEIETLKNRIHFLLEEILRLPDAPIHQLSILPNDERERLLHAFSDSAVACPHDKIYEDVYPMTTTQRDIYLDCMKNPGGYGYRLAAYHVLDRPVSPAAWKKAVRFLVKRYPVLRSEFVVDEGSFYQGIRPFDPEDVDSRHLELSDAGADDRSLDEYLKGRLPLLNDLSEKPAKFFLFGLGGDRFAVAVSIHHIFCDAMSFKILFEELDRLYAILEDGGEPDDPPEDSYKEYVFFHRNRFDTSAVEEHWRGKFEGVEPLSRNACRTDGDFVKEEAVVDSAEARRVLDFCRRSGVSSAVYFKALYAIMIRYYCQADVDFHIREIVSGRHEGFLNTMGCLIHVIPTVVRRTFLEGSSRFGDFLQDLRHQKKVLGDRQYISNLLQSHFTGPQEIVFEYNYLMGMLALALRGGEREMRQISAEMENVVQLEVKEEQDGYLMRLLYHSRFFCGIRFLERMILLSHQMVSGAVRLGDLEYLLDGEKGHLDGFNATDAAYPRDLNLVELFEEQVGRCPNRVAVVFEDAQLTYRQLNEKANRLAHHLRGQCGIESEELVGVMLNRSEQMIVGLLGVLKAGAAYVPIDPDYPRSRVEYMLSDSGCRVVVTESGRMGLFSGSGGIRPIDIRSISDGPGDNPLCPVGPSDRAYAIYTSGSTGRPKGVVVEHGSLVNAAFAWRKAYGLDVSDVRLLQMASLSFDVFTGDLIRALTNGGRLIICPSDVRADPASLYELMARHGITIFESTPGVILPLMEYVHEKSLDMSFLKLLILGSDSVRTEHYRELVERFGRGMRIVNSYGVTEASIDSSFFEAEAAAIPLTATTPIGRPLQNTRFYVLDPGRRLLPAGIVGELYIGGAGVAQGYLNPEKATAERFIPNPLKSGERLYRTGDRVRWLPDGNMEFLGRNDDQVKVRGYRVELGEIQNRLVQHETVKEAVVLARVFQDGGTGLVAYVVGHAGLNAAALRTHLRTTLPEYMVPPYFVQVEGLPLTPSGKVDKKALPDPVEARMERGTDFAPPRDEEERKLSRIWQEVLGVDRVGIRDNFFDLGGHSLKATRVLSRIHKELGVEIRIREVFDHPTIEELAGVVRKSSPSGYSEIPPLDALGKTENGRFGEDGEEIAPATPAELEMLSE